MGGGGGGRQLHWLGPANVIQMCARKPREPRCIWGRQRRGSYGRPHSEHARSMCLQSEPHAHICSRQRPVPVLVPALHNRQHCCAA